MIDIDVSRLRTALGLLILASAALLVPESARAYGGPGSIVSGIGAFLAALAAVVAAIFGFLWFPLKKLYRKLRGDRERRAEAEPAKEAAGD